MGATLQLSTKIHQDTSSEAPHLRRRAPARPARLFVADAQGRGSDLFDDDLPTSRPFKQLQEIRSATFFRGARPEGRPNSRSSCSPPTYKIPTVTSNYINLLPPRTATDRRSRNPAPLTMMSRPTKPIASDKDVKPTVYRPTASDGGIIFPRVENAEFKKKKGREGYRRIDIAIPLPREGAIELG